MILVTLGERWSEIPRSLLSITGQHFQKVIKPEDVAFE